MTTLRVQLRIAVSALVLATLYSPPAALASGVVGSGTPASCTEGALEGALAGGGNVTFDCGSSPITILVTNPKDVPASLRVSIDGGGLITLDGGGVTPVFGILAGASLLLANLTISNAGSSVPDPHFPNGGAISNAGKLTVTNCTFFNNSGSAGGGAISSAVLSPRNTLPVTTVTNCTFSENTGAAGAIYNTGKLNVTNSTFVSNSGGIANGAGLSRITTAVTNCTFSSNGSPVFSGNLSALRLKNTIVAGSTLCGAVRDRGHNLDSGTSCGFTLKTSLSDSDPRLDSTGLAENGGPTQTIAVEAGSPAINGAGCSVRTDQRSYKRPGASAVHCTIGAYEFNSPGCPKNLIACGEMNSCTNLSKDSQNCGSCKHVCPNAQPCVRGICAAAPPTPTPTRTPTPTPAATATRTRTPSATITPTETANATATAAAAACNGASKIWIGSGDGHSWGDANNWSGQVLPSPTDTVCVPAGTPGVDITSAVTAKWLIANRGLNVRAGLTLTDPVVVSQLNADAQFSYGTATGAIAVAAGATLTAGSSSIIRATVTGAGTLNVTGQYGSYGILDADITAGGLRTIRYGALIKTHHIEAGATLELLTYGHFHLLSGATLINDGTLHFDDPAPTGYDSPVFDLDCDNSGGNPATVVNNGRIELSANSMIGSGETYYGIQYFGSACTNATPILTNSPGAVITTTSPGSAAGIYVAIDNQGLVDAATNEIGIWWPSTPIAGVWRSSSNGGEIHFFNGLTTFANPTLENNVRISSGTAIGTVTIAAGGTLTVDGGIIQASVVGAGTLNVTGQYGSYGILDADITAGGLRTIRYGALINTHHIEAGATLELLTYGHFHLLSGATLINDGTLHFDDPAPTGYDSPVFDLDCDNSGSNPATVVNNGRIELSANSMIGSGETYYGIQYFGSACTNATPILTNSPGAVITTTSPGSAAGIYVAIDNQGLVDAATNEIGIWWPSTPITGVWRSSSNGGEIHFFNGLTTFANPTLENNVRISSGTAIGTVTIAAGGTLTVDGGIIQASVVGAGTLNVTGQYGSYGILDADITAGGLRTIRYGALINTHHIEVGATLELLTYGHFHLLSGATLINDGTLHFDDPAPTGYDSPVFDLDCDNSGSNPATVVNNGRIELSANSMIGSGETYYGIQYFGSACTNATPVLTNAPDGTITSSGSSISAGIENAGHIHAGAGSMFYLGGAVDNRGLIEFDEGADWSSTNTVNEDCGQTQPGKCEIRLNDGGEFHIGGTFSNFGLITFYGTSPREIQRIGKNVYLGNGALFLDTPGWANIVHNTCSAVGTGCLPAPPVFLPLPFTCTGLPFKSNLGYCVSGDVGFGIGGSLEFCTVGHFDNASLLNLLPCDPVVPNSFYPTQQKYVVTLGAGVLFGASFGLGGEFQPFASDINEEDGWQVCVGGDFSSGDLGIPVNVGIGAEVCKGIPRGDVFPLGSEKNVFLNYIMNANPFKRLTVDVDVSASFPGSIEPPWCEEGKPCGNGFVSFFYTAVEDYTP